MTKFSNRLIKPILCVLASGLIPACTPGQQGSSNPPLFGGLTSATPSGTPGQISLVWAPATDNSGTGITYNVFWVVGAIPAQSGMEALHFSTTNSTGVTLTGLVADPYIFYVQAQDGTGASDGNTNEVAGTVP
jgi:hypothetical protein